MVDPDRAVSFPGSGRLCEAMRCLAQGVRCTLLLLLGPVAVAGSCWGCVSGWGVTATLACVCVLDESNRRRHLALVCVCGGVC